jgi:CubicO group peptidase (beta-lactamase class C family)
MKRSCVLIGLCCALGLPFKPHAVTNTYPGEKWENLSPEEAGVNAAALDRIEKSGDGVIVRHGYVVYSWGDPSSRGDWASATKPVISTMVGFAIEEGKCTMDSRASEFEPRLSGKDEKITLQHLATMTSGYALAEQAGEAWAYNDVAIMLYHRVVFEKIFGEEAKQAIEKRLVSHLRFEDSWRVGPRLSASVRDMARFGLLYLRGGKWNGTRVIDASFLRQATRNQVPAGLPRTAGRSVPGTAGEETYGGGKDQCEVGPGHYGYNWWTNENGLWPDVPRDAYQANGHWGNETVTVIPSYDLVIACLGDIGGWKEMNVFLANILGAVEKKKQ